MALGAVEGWAPTLLTFREPTKRAFLLRCWAPVEQSSFVVLSIIVFGHHFIFFYFTFICCVCFMSLLFIVCLSAECQHRIA